MNSIELINELLYDFVNEKIYLNDKTRTNIFDYTESLKNLLYENMPSIYARKYKRKMPLDESIKKAREFFEYLDPIYALHMDLRLFNGTFEFESEKDIDESKEDIDELKEDFYSASGLYEDNTRYIRIVYEETFADVYAIIHEVLHDTNVMIPPDDEVLTNDERAILSNRETFTELISILGTLIAREYFIANGEKEADIDMMHELYALSDKCEQLDYAIKMVNLYIEKGFITRYDLFSLMEGKDKLSCDAIKDYLLDVLREEDLRIFFNERYLTGFALSYYILNKYDNPSEVLKELNEIITTGYIEDVFNYLDLGFIVSDDKYLVGISDDTKEVLGKAFKQQVKRMR